MDIIGNRKIFLTIAGLFVFASIISVSIFGFKQGIDFAGGTLWHFVIKTQGMSDADIRITFAEAKVTELVLTGDLEFGGYIARMRDISESEHQAILSALRGKFGEVEELRYEAIGPSIGRELRRNAFIALGLVIIAIALFVAFAFRKVSHPVSSWKYGIVALITLCHDVILPVGLFALLGYIYGIEIDTNFIVALLVVIAFSVNDTIVVFDRIRENLLLSRRDADFALTVNNSINQTMARSINTSLTLVFILVALYFFGPASLKYFTLTLFVGIVAGTYSSIFVASPLLVVWHRFRK